MWSVLCDTFMNWVHGSQRRAAVDPTNACHRHSGIYNSLVIPSGFHNLGISNKTSFSYPQTFLNYYPCQGQSALSMPNFNEASLSDTLQLVYSYKILWETGSLIPFCIGHYYNNQSSHQWLLLLRKKLPISLI